MRWHLDAEPISRALADVVAGRCEWEGCLDALSSSVGATGAVLLSTTKPNMVVSTQSVSESTQRYVTEGWYRHDIRFRGLPKIKRTGLAVDLDFTDETEMRRSPYYNDFLAPHQLKWSACLGVPTTTGYWALSFQRTSRQGPFSQPEQTSLLGLRPIIHAAIEVFAQISDARAKGLLEGMELLRTAALIFDSTGRVAHLNSSAAMLTNGPALRIERGRLVASSSNHSAQITQYIKDAVDDPALGLRPPIVIPHRAAPLDRPYLIYVLPLPTMWIGHPIASLRAVALIVDLQTAKRPPLEHLAVVFDLTPAEAHLALTLSETLSLDKAAEELSVTKETARSQLRAVFAKTTASKQSEVIALVARLLDFGKN